MDGQTLVFWLIVGGVAGWLAGLFVRGSGYGLIGDIVVGIIGAFVGGWIVRTAHLSLHIGNPWLAEGLVAFIGAVVLMLILGLLRPRSFSERTSDWWRRR